MESVDQASAVNKHAVSSDKSEAVKRSTKERTAQITKISD